MRNAFYESVVNLRWYHNLRTIREFVPSNAVKFYTTLTFIYFSASGREICEKSDQLEGRHPVQGICAASFKIRRIMLRGKGVLIINSRIRRKQTMI